RRHAPAYCAGGLRPRLPRSALPLRPGGLGAGGTRPDGMAGARRHRHRRARAQRGHRAAAWLRGDRRTPLWRGQDRHPAQDAMSLVVPLYVLRHGETAWNIERRMQGAKDSALTERGRQQAEAMGRTLKRELAQEPGPTIFLRSPLGRARETSEIIGRE